MRAKIALLAAVAAMMSQCTEANLDELSDGALASNQQQISIEVSSHDQTRMAIDPDEANDIWYVTWESTDMVGGWSNSDQSLWPFELESLDPTDANIATFGGVGTEGEMRLLYPYDASALVEGCYTIDLSQQSVDLGTDAYAYYGDNNLYMISDIFEVQAGQSRPTTTPTMRHLLATMELEVSISTLTSDTCRLTKAIVYGLDSSATLSFDDASLTPTQGSITLEIANSPLLSEGESVEILFSAIPFTTSCDITIELYLNNGDMLTIDKSAPAEPLAFESGSYNTLTSQLDLSESNDEVTPYESVDYSLDGTVMQLQEASVGDGINLVFVGDGFADTQMAEYERRMGEAMEHFFSEEPFATLRDRYNVYSVYAVSKNNGIAANRESCFECEFGSGTAISGNDSKVFVYALKVPDITTTANLTVVTVLNSYEYAGTCYMYYGNDAAVAYCPIVENDDELFRQIIVHEAGGHGFAKLVDEYDYPSYGYITTSAVSTIATIKSLGWAANVDTTNDTQAISWSHLLADSRYDGNVGIYQGAYLYPYGAYRPSDNSIMRHNTGGYNAPSREEIYRRAITLSGGEYSYEEFVAYDECNLSAAAMASYAAQTAGVDEDEFVHLAPPVMIAGTP